MGCDILATANHRLDTTSIERLATDLSARLQARVKYGHYNDVLDFMEEGGVGAGDRVLHLCNALEESDDKGTIVFELYDSENYSQYYIWIYRDSFRAFADYPSGRFGIFCRTFTGKYRYWERELQYRKDVYTEVLLLGGDTAIYHGDQCGASFVGYDAETMPFATILERVKALKNVVNMSGWLRSFSGNYLGNEPDAFIDDFSYWPTLEEILARSR